MKTTKNIVLFLTNNVNTFPLFQWMADKTKAFLYSEKLDANTIHMLHPQLILSYNYDHIIPDEVIQATNGNIVNMHISFLPWNRGFSPNLWSFIDSTPKGVTIHKLSTGLDKGNIIFQKELFFDAETETFSSTYQKLNEAISDMCKVHFEELLSGAYSDRPQVGQGSYHSLKDLKELQTRLPFSWNDNIDMFLSRYRQIKAE